MSKSFEIINGDLDIGGGRGFSVVTGRKKLKQDLKMWVLEKIGTDPATPTFGTRLDGGVIDGEPVDTLIGDLMTEANLNIIRQEIVDLVVLYQSMQYEKVRAESIAYGGRNTLDADEIIEEIDSISLKLFGTMVIVNVYVLTLAGNRLRITMPLTSEM